MLPLMIKTDRGFINLSSGIVIEDRSKNEQPVAIVKTLKKEFEYKGSDAKVLLERARIVHKTVSKLGIEGLAAAHSVLFNFRPRKKRGPKQKEITKRRLTLLETCNNTQAANILADEYFAVQKTLYLAEGYSEERANYMAASDSKVFRTEELARLRSVRSDYELGKSKHRRRKNKPKLSAKKIKR